MNENNLPIDLSIHLIDLGLINNKQNNSCKENNILLLPANSSL